MPGFVLLRRDTPTATCRPQRRRTRFPPTLQTRWRASTALAGTGRSEGCRARRASAKASAARGDNPKPRNIVSARYSQDPHLVEANANVAVVTDAEPPIDLSSRPEAIFFGSPDLRF